jgi:hypothetical protein
MHIGNRRIKEMESFGDEILTFDGEACLVVDRDSQGRSGFGGVSSWIDCRSENVNALERVAFSSEGSTGRRSGCGQGWRMLGDGASAARVYIHESDEPFFLAFPLVEMEE